MINGSNLAESSKESYGSETAVWPMMMMMMIHVLCFHLQLMNIGKQQ
jgi:hypothetical protein